MTDFFDNEDDQPYTLCPRCGRKVDPAGDGVHYAVELLDAPAMGRSHIVEGMGGFFHTGCAVLPGWRPKPKP